MTGSSGTSRPESSYKAVVQVAPPAESRCGRFERGHHGHPVQVALAMKQAGDDRRFRPVRLSAATTTRVADQDVASVELVSDDDGEHVALINHDPVIVDRLAAIEDPFMVWEPTYGVLFFMTEQARDAMGTGSITCCPLSEFTACEASTG